MKLKMKPEHFEAFRKEVKLILAENPDAVEFYEKGRFTKSWETKDLNRRFRADVAWIAIRNSDDLSYNALYEYLNDDNIQAAVKQLVPVLTRRF